MSGFYNPKRNAAWNYGGAKWKLSRSKIDLFLECPRCFYVDNKLGTKRPPGFPFNLNSAVDSLLKNEFDFYRAKKEPHPIMEEHGLNAIPFEHPDLDTWRENFEGVQYKDTETGMTISGAVDDVWIDRDTEELIVVDYKSTSKETAVNLDADWQIGYKRQMEVYQWLLRKNGFKVSDTGYFVYANGDAGRDMFEATLHFDVTLHSYTGKADWIDDVLKKIQDCLQDKRVPKPGRECDYCVYRETVGKTLQSLAGVKVEAPKQVTKKTVKKPTKKTTDSKDDQTNATLF